MVKHTRLLLVLQDWEREEDNNQQEDFHHPCSMKCWEASAAILWYKTINPTCVHLYIQLSGSSNHSLTGSEIPKSPFGFSLLLDFPST